MQVAGDTVASTLYVQNWNLVAAGSDYLAHGAAVSPLQHFWSLSVEEQYYLAWPVLIAGVAAVCAARGWALKRGYVLVVTGVTAASFGCGLWLTGQEPSVAYLATHARVWQLGAGSLLAIVMWKRRTRLTWRARTVALWLGLAGLLASVWLIGSGTPYPGWAALLPTIATMLVIAAEDPDPRGRLTARPVMHAPAVRWLGDISYSLYIWHWPLLILPPVILGRELGAVETLLAVAASLAVAGVSTAWVENPIRRSRLRQDPPRALLLGAGLMAVVVLSALWLRAAAQEQIAASQRAAADALANPDECLGAGSLVPGRECPDDPELVTTPEFALLDQSPAILPECLNWVPYTELLTCHGGDPNGATRVALFGNSHAGQWLPAIDEIGKADGWVVDTYIVGMCKPTADEVTYVEGVGPWGPEQLSQACEQFQSSLIPHIAAQSYDIVVMSSQDYEGLTDAGDYDGTFEVLAASGAQLVVIRDTPAPMNDRNQADCLAESGVTSGACDGSLQDWVVPDPFRDAALAAGVPVVDMTDLICDQDESCPAVVGGVIVIGDSGHLTRTYVLTTVPMLRERLLTALP